MRLIFILLFTGAFVQAQTLIEDSEISENSEEFVRVAISYELDHPTEYYRLKCGSPVYARFTGGESAFKQNISKQMKGFLDTGLYTVNGTFELILFIGKNGSLQRFQLKPEVTNRHLLERDVELALRKMNPSWTPATCNGIPVDSRIRQKINFRTDSFDL